MIILDLNQVLFSTLLSTYGTKNLNVEEGLIRHMALNCIRSYRQRFSNEYGEIVIACDNREYWRKQVFPYYKANRKKNRDQIGLDWDAVFRAMNNVKSELKEFFPYRVIDVPGAEADDVIGTLVQNKHEVAPDEKILIMSGDKDFIQLHNDVVVQYDPVQKKWVKHPEPERYLIEHVVKGDSGDGIPNIRSADNTFVVGQRQKTISKKFLEQFVEDTLTHRSSVISGELARNYKRNLTLIDLRYIPETVRMNVLESYRSQSDKNRSHLFNYFIKYKLANLMESINEF